MRDRWRSGRTIADCDAATLRAAPATKVWIENYRRDAFVESVDNSLDSKRLYQLTIPALAEDGCLDRRADGALNEVRLPKRSVVSASAISAQHRWPRGDQLRAAPLITNQIEYHTYLDHQSALTAAARSEGLSVTATTE